MNRAQLVIEGRGSISELCSHVPNSASSGLFIVAARKSRGASGAQVLIDELAKQWPIVLFAAYETNPRIEDITKAVELFRSRGCGAILGIGGGTALDIAKAAALLATHRGDTVAYLKDQSRLQPRSVELLAVPTTAGTGSEATHFAVVYCDGQKYSLAHPSMLPDRVVLDATLTDSLPPFQTACTGWDALAQAIESLWSNLATDESRSFSLEALDLCLNNLSEAVTSPTPASRDQMLRAANLAGRAINIARTTGAHALSYRLTHDHGLPHGHAVALTLPALMEYNLNQLGPANDLYRLLSDRLAAGTPSEAGEYLRRLLKETGLSNNLTDVGVGEETLESLVGSALASGRADNNPVKLDHDALMAILHKSL